MGATQFMVVARGKTAAEAFRNAVDEACRQHGHGGYTGTVAEKESFVVLPLAPGADPRELAQQMLDCGDPRFDDKFGPAGAFKLSAESWFFFGWASS